MLEVLHRDSELVAIDKPSGLLVHPTELSTDTDSCLALLRDQLGQWVYPVHRLDRATSGVLLFALNPEMASELGRLFREKLVRKTYFAVVRGWLDDEGEINKALRKDFLRADSPLREALTRYKTLARTELSFGVGRYPTARYSLAEVETRTGRLHQIRRHMAGISHHLLGDTVHGDGKHNRFVREKFSLSRLLLHATSVEFTHPTSKNQLVIRSTATPEFISGVQLLFTEPLLINKT